VVWAAPVPAVTLPAATPRAATPSAATVDAATVSPATVPAEVVTAVGRSRKGWVGEYYRLNADAALTKGVVGLMLAAFPIYVR